MTSLADVVLARPASIDALPDGALAVSESGARRLGPWGPAMPCLINGQNGTYLGGGLAASKVRAIWLTDDIVAGCFWRLFKDLSHLEWVHVDQYHTVPHLPLRLHAARVVITTSEPGRPVAEDLRSADYADQLERWAVCGVGALANRLDITR